MIRQILVWFAVQYIRAQGWRHELLSEAHLRIRYPKHSYLVAQALAEYEPKLFQPHGLEKR